MSDFALGHAAGGDGRALTKSCADQLVAAGAAECPLGFVYVTSPLAAGFAGIVAELRMRTGIASWVGTVGQGVCATGAEYFGEPAIVALACRTAPDAFRILRPVQEAGDGSAEAGFPAAVGIVHGDPRNGAVTEIVAAVAERHGAYLVGGLSSAEAAFPQAVGDVIAEGGVSGVLLGVRGLKVAVGLTQGCLPIGAAHAVTRGEGQIIAELDGRPAFEVLRLDAGAAEGADPRRWLAGMHVALPVAGSDKADYVVRNLVGIDPDRGLVAIADTVARGDRVMFVRRDRDSAERDLTRMLAEAKARTPSPKAGLYFSCLARGPNLFREAAHEMRAIEGAFGALPVVGFFGNGEIASDRVYGYTGVLTLFS